MRDSDQRSSLHTGFQIIMFIYISAFVFAFPVGGLCVSPFPVEIIRHARNSGFIRPERKGDTVAFGQVTMRNVIYYSCNSFYMQ